MEINYKLVGQRMQQLRKANNITQEQIADSLNTTVAFISNIENNRTKMNLRVLTYYASVLNVSVDYLLGKTANENKPSPVPVQNESRFGPETQKVINELLAKLRAMPDKKQEEAARGALTYVRGVVNAEDQEGKA